MTVSVGWWLHAARHNQDRSYCKPATHDYAKSARTGSQQLSGLLDDVLCLILLQLGFGCKQKLHALCFVD